MAIALPILVHLFAPLQGAVEWLAGGAPAGDAAGTQGSVQSGAQDGAQGSAQTHRLASGHEAAPSGAARVRSRVHARATPVGKAARAWAGPTRAPERPLRVVRVLEGRHPRSSAGRMVISGRMADVCAELDRLAALEAPFNPAR
mgnify:CR=1 FL=1